LLLDTNVLINAVHISKTVDLFASEIAADSRIIVIRAVICRQTFCGMVALIVDAAGSLVSVLFDLAVAVRCAADILTSVVSAYARF